MPPGGWVGGDSWFGPISTAVEVMARFGVHSTWIIKQNQQWFPMKPRYSVLKACFKDQPAGHWVTFVADISGVTLIALTYEGCHTFCQRVDQQSLLKNYTCLILKMTSGM
jgi:hypothetical protein